ncbi:MAG: hypothetical protein FWE37_04115 [Spirochaetaceae bacterium]|nr:hypothetical protein [Spirochaetaceae bacterium]
MTTKLEVTSLQQFNQLSEEIFLELADNLPVLLTELNEDASPWLGKRTDIFDAFIASLYGLSEFMKLSHEEDINLFVRTHANFDLTLNTSSDETIAKYEKTLNILLRKAEREFVELFTLTEVFYDTGHMSFEDKALEVVRALQGLDKRMADTVKQANGVSRPILLAMEEIQKQDIMRQSIEQVIMVIEEYHNEEGLDEELEKITFKVDLLELAQNIINEVKKLASTVKVAFNERIEQIADILKQMEELRFTIYQSDKEGQLVSCDVNAILTNIKDILANLNEPYLRYFARKTKIIKAHRAVLRKAQQFLNKAGDNEEELKAMNIIGKVVAAEMQTVHDTASTAINEHYDFINTRDDLVTTLELLASLYTEMLGIIKNVPLYTHKFLNYFTTVKDKVTQIDTAINFLTEAEQAIEVVKGPLKERHEQLLKEANLTKYDLKSQRIIKLTERFTILSNKKVAGEIVGFDVEQGIDDSEIILF